VGAGWQAVRLRCAGDQLAMAVVLPDRGRLADVQRRLDGAALARLLGSFKPAYVDLRMPRWSMRSRLSLKETLAAMGMPTAFVQGSADFTGMTTRERLYISAVLHEAFVAVDERGIEAAAATAVIAKAVSLPPPGVPVVVDRPFLFVVHDVATATPLFVGRVDDPSATAK
jgi:serpin B